MPHKLKPGAAVRQVMLAPYKGHVMGYVVDQTTGDVQVHVACKVVDTEGVEHIDTKYFIDENLELDPDGKDLKVEAKE